jgi:hypothetical protein
MKKLPALVLLFSLVFAFSGLDAQSDAALQKVNSRYSPEQVADMQSHTSYKYQGLLLFYSHSWLVDHQGQLLAPTESEILTIDIDQYNPMRSESSRVSIHDDATGMDLVLLGRQEFEVLVLSKLNAADKAAYLAQKAILTNESTKQAQ